MFTTKQIKQCENLALVLAVSTPSYFIPWFPEEVLRVNFPIITSICFFVIVQFWAGQSCSHTSASSGQLKLQPPAVQFCLHCSPLHSREQLPELQSWRHDGELHTPRQPPSEHCCREKKSCSTGRLARGYINNKLYLGENMHGHLCRDILRAKNRIVFWELRSGLTLEVELRRSIKEEIMSEYISLQSQIEVRVPASKICLQRLIVVVMIESVESG